MFFVSSALSRLETTFYLRDPVVPVGSQLGWGGLSKKRSTGTNEGHIDPVQHLLERLYHDEQKDETLSLVSVFIDIFAVRLNLPDTYNSTFASCLSMSETR